MPFFENEAEKQEADAMLLEAFEAFKEPISIYKTAEQVIVGHGPTFNFAYGANQPSVTVDSTPETGVFQGTVNYFKGGDNLDSNAPVDDLRYKMRQADVRICIEGDARNFLEGAEKVMLDGMYFTVANGPIPRGMFSRDQFDYFLNKIQ